MRLTERLNAFSADIHASTLRRLLVVMLLFSLLRVVFFLYNLDFFQDVTPKGALVLLLGGLKFDLVAVLYTNILFIFLMVVPFQCRYSPRYQQVARTLYLFTNSIAIALNCIDTVYFRFTLRRTTQNALQEFGNETNLLQLTGRFLLDYWFMVVLFVAFVLLLRASYGKAIEKPQTLASPRLYYPIGVLLLCASTILFVGGVRGGFANSIRPITLSNAGQYVERPLEMAIVLNTPFAIYKTLEITPLEKKDYFKDQAAIDTYFSPIHLPKDTAVFRSMNVVVIILESFGTEYIGALNGLEKGYTPFLDSLIGEGYTFNHSYANGKKSIDAMPSVLASIPSLVEPYVLTPYAGNEINSIASLLNKKGYETAFFHGAPNGSMGFQAFAKIAGYDHYLGKDEFGDNAHYDGQWGIWDEEFMQFYAQKMNGLKEPFHTTLFTVSSHHPYEVPDHYKGKFPEGELKIHKCIGYTDNALRRFFATASAMPWFGNTLFVITADHTNVDTHLRRFQTSAGVFAVPILFYKSGSELKGKADRLAQQNDIMPTVLHYLGYDAPFIAFGNDALQKDSSAFVVNYNGFYQIFEGEHLLQFDGDQTIALYNFRNDILLKENLVGRYPAVQLALEQRLKAYIQEYNARLIDNRLTINKR